MNDFLPLCEKAVLDGSRDEAAALARTALERGYDILPVIEAGFSSGVREAGARWERGEYFLPELAFSAEAMKAAMAILQPVLLASGEGRLKSRVLIGTVQGDIHDIGKSLVTTMLLANNHEVIDLGADVAHARFVEEVRDQKPDVLCLSALLTTTMTGQGTVIELLRSEGLRESVRVLVGGAPTTVQWAREIGADGYGEHAVAAVAVVEELVS